jgi:AcrR family transcriptional regulator
MSAIEPTLPERTLPYGEGRSALLAAAVRVVAQRGLRHLTYRAVAQEAGVTHGLVTHHFGTRDALVHAALEYSLQNSITAITADPGTGRMDSLFEGLAELVQGDPGTQAFQYELILEARRRPELLPHVEAIYGAYHEALRAELELAGIESDDAFVHLIFSALEGLVFQQTALGHPDATRASLDRLRELLLLVRKAHQR